MNTKQIEQSGHRITKARKQILELFKGDHVTLSIKEILKRIGDSADRATVYRNLNFLEMINLLTSFTSEEQTFYELAEHNHHHHLICKKCGSKTEFLPKVIESAINDAKTIAKDDYNFVVTDHQLEFYGYCQKCKEL